MGRLVYHLNISLPLAVEQLLQLAKLFLGHRQSSRGPPATDGAGLFGEYQLSLAGTTQAIGIATESDPNFRLALSKPMEVDRCWNLAALVFRQTIEIGIRRRCWLGRIGGWGLV